VLGGSRRFFWYSSWQLGGAESPAARSSADDGVGQDGFLASGGSRAKSGGGTDSWVQGKLVGGESGEWEAVAGSDLSERWWRQKLPETRGKALPSSVGCSGRRLEEGGGVLTSEASSGELYSSS
jgi:hypothetical protein